MLLQKVIFYKKFKCRKGMKLTSLRKSDRWIIFIFNTWAKSRIRDIPTDQRIFNIDTVTTKMIPESSNKTGQVFKFFTEVNWPVFIPRKIWKDQSYVSLSWMINWKTKTFRFEKKTWQKAKISGFSKGWKEWLKLRIFLINKARSNWAVFNTKSQILIINLIRRSDTKTIIEPLKNRMLGIRM